MIRLPSDVAALLARLHDAGFAAYVVGGCVRDSLRGVTPADWDVTTSALPEQTLALFADYRTIPLGLSHGTVAILTDERTVEITTFRTESGYSDRRRPDAVAFVTDVTEDLRRRDFTVNAMAYNEHEGLIDPFSGQADLAARRLRCVGDPTARFDEDALRILRGLRFASVLGFSLDHATATALHAQRELLRAVAAERVAAELSRLICGGNAFCVLRDFRDVIAVVLPDIAPMFDFEQHNPHHQYDVYLHTLHALAAIPPEPVLRWAALLHDSGKPARFTMDEQGVGHFKGHAEVSVEITERALAALRLDNETIRTVSELVRYHDRPIAPAKAAVKRVLSRLGETGLRRLIALKRADNAAHAPETDTRTADLHTVESLLDEILEEQACFSLRDLAVKGSDITDIGVPEGPMVGQVLRYLLDAVIDERCENERNALLKLTGEFLGNEEAL